MNARTLLDKIWDAHVVPREHAQQGDPDLLYIDLHLVHEVTSPQAFAGLSRAGRRVRRPELTLATVDHAVPTAGRAAPWTDAQAVAQVEALRASCRGEGIRLFDVDDARQGIVHVVGPEQGLTHPGTTIVCGDSHTSTHGAFGALAFGIGTSEVEHVLATQTLPQVRPRALAVDVVGALPVGVSAKDLALTVVRTLGPAGGSGSVIEFRGQAVRGLDMAGRMTLCNMSIEAGARAGMIGPDDTTFAWLEGRPFAPRGPAWEQAVERWRGFATDPEARFDERLLLPAHRVEPSVTWGTTPAHNVAVGDRVPDPDEVMDDAERARLRRALDYMGLQAGTAISDIAIDRVFVGSCTNARIEDLRAAAAVLRGRKVASRVRAMVVPGSGLVKAQAEREGIDRVFVAAGFEWREPGCSMCLGMNGDVLAPGERCASTSNRNFEGRQGRGGRTHLVSPAMAAAAAVAGHFVDVRTWEVES